MDFIYSIIEIPDRLVSLSTERGACYRIAASMIEEEGLDVHVAAIPVTSLFHATFIAKSKRAPSNPEGAQLFMEALYHEALAAFSE